MVVYTENLSTDIYLGLKMQKSGIDQSAQTQFSRYAQAAGVPSKTH